NSRARRRKSSAPGLREEGSPGKPVVKVGGVGVVKRTAYLRRRGCMYRAAVYFWAAVSFRRPPFFLPPGAAFLVATLAPKSKVVSNLLLAMTSPRSGRASLHYPAVPPARAPWVPTSRDGPRRRAMTPGAAWSTTAPAGGK